VQRAIGTTDPGAVPGGSTTDGVFVAVDDVFDDGAELGSTWAEKRCFCPGWRPRKTVQNL